MIIWALIKKNIYTHLVVHPCKSVIPPLRAEPTLQKSCPFFTGVIFCTDEVGWGTYIILYIHIYARCQPDLGSVVFFQLV